MQWSYDVTGPGIQTGATSITNGFGKPPGLTRLLKSKFQRNLNVLGTCSQIKNLKTCLLLCINNQLLYNLIMELNITLVFYLNDMRIIIHKCTSRIFWFSLWDLYGHMRMKIIETKTEVNILISEMVYRSKDGTISTWSNMNKYIGDYLESKLTLT